MRLHLLIGTCALIFFALHAPDRAQAAGWRYAQWGMTEREVEDASNGEALPTGADTAAYWEIVPRLSSPERFGPFDMEAEFYFDDAGGLSSVRLLPIDNIWCLDMIKYLMRKFTYQGPVEESYVWRDRNNGNRVQLGRFAKCTVTFLPGTSRDASAVR